MSRIQQILDKAEREGTHAPHDFASAKCRHPPRRAAGDPAAPGSTPPAGTATARRGPAAVAAPAAPPARRPLPRAPSPSPLAMPARAADARLAPLGSPRSSPTRPPPSSTGRSAPASRSRSTAGTYRAILVTSPSPGDGKSVTALNLALDDGAGVPPARRAGGRGPARPVAAQPARHPRTPGPRGRARRRRPLEDALVRCPTAPRGAAGGQPRDQPTELLGSAAMRRMLDTLRTQFDRVIIDTPPATPLADVGVLAPAGRRRAPRRPGGTSRRGRRSSGRSRTFDPARILGLVLNDVEEAAADYGYGGPTRRRRRRSPRPRGEKRVRRNDARQKRAAVQPVRLGARPGGIRGRAPPDLRLGCRSPCACTTRRRDRRHGARGRPCSRRSLCQLCLYYNDFYDLTLVQSSRELVVRLLQAAGAASLMLAALYVARPGARHRRGVVVTALCLFLVGGPRWRLLFYRSPARGVSRSAS